MAISSLGGMAQTFAMRRQNARFQQDLTRLSHELASGQTADVVAHLSGDTGGLARLDHGLALNETYGATATEAASFSAAMQAAFEVIQTGAAGLRSSLMSIDNSNLPQLRATASAMGNDELHSAIGVLNTSVSGRAVFAGAATDSRAVISADALLAEVRTAVAGETTLAGVTSRLEDWFNAPTGGFTNVAYTGATAPMSAFRLGNEQSVTMDQRADSPEIRNHLMSLSMVVLAGDDTLALPDNQRAAMLDQAAQRLTGGQDTLTHMRARLGAAQERIDTEAARLSTERSVLQIARADLLSVDPYDAATELENLQFRMETMYAVTVRLSRLSLAEFMK